MANSFGDARLRELTLLSEVNETSYKTMFTEFGPEREMVASLVERGFLLGRIIAWQHRESPPRLSGGLGIAGQSDLEQMIQRIRVDTLSQVLGGLQVELHLTHLGRLRLAELRETLTRSNRIREPFGVLWDGRHFDQDLRIALLDTRTDSPITVAFLDLNGLGTVNNQFGHDAGDVAIRAYFAAISAGLETTGDAYRVGGDEVTVVISETVDEAVEVLKRVCLLLMQERLHYDQLELPTLSISVGITTATDPRGNPADLREKADKAMYRAKEHTRHEKPRPSTIASDCEERIIVVGLS